MTRKTQAAIARWVDMVEGIRGAASGYHRRVRWSVALLVVGCSGGKGPAVVPVATAKPTASAEVPSAPEPSHLESSYSAAEPAPSRPKLAAPKKGRFLRVQVPDQSPEMPCDFTRSFTGTIGGTAGVWGSGTDVALVLKRSASGGVSGATHYAGLGPGIPVTGVAKGDGSFVFTERGGGRFSGKCDKGVLRGTFAMGAKTQSFDLVPHAADRPALYSYVREKTSGSCELRVTDIGYFGGSAALNQRITRALDSGGYEGWLPEVTACKHYLSHAQTTYVTAFGPGFVTLGRSSSSDYGGAHPLNSSHPAGAIDLKTGRTLSFDDIITDERLLRDLMPGCIDDFLAVSDLDESDEVHAPITKHEDSLCDAYPHQNYLWFCDAQPRKPNWSLTSEGVAIAASGHVHAEAFRDGNGPIISWATLERIGALKATSPMKHLWADVAPAGADTPPCTAGLTGMGVVRFTPFVRD